MSQESFVFLNNAPKRAVDHSVAILSLLNIKLCCFSTAFVDEATPLSCALKAHAASTESDFSVALKSPFVTLEEK